MWPGRAGGEVKGGARALEAPLAARVHDHAHRARLARLKRRVRLGRARQRVEDHSGERLPEGCDQRGNRELGRSSGGAQRRSWAAAFALVGGAGEIRGRSGGAQRSAGRLVGGALRLAAELLLHVVLQRGELGRGEVHLQIEGDRVRSCEALDEAAVWAGDRKHPTARVRQNGERRWMAGMCRRRGGGE